MRGRVEWGCQCRGKPLATKNGDKMPPSKNREPKSGCQSVLLAIGLVGFLVVSYVLSIGPAKWLSRDGKLDRVQWFVEIFYRPISWLDASCPPFHDFFVWYMDFF
jgi:hypothetical protein